MTDDERTNEQRQHSSGGCAQCLNDECCRWEDEDSGYVYLHCRKHNKRSQVMKVKDIAFGETNGDFWEKLWDFNDRRDAAWYRHERQHDEAYQMHLKRTANLTRGGKRGSHFDDWPLGKREAEARRVTTEKGQRPFKSPTLRKQRS